MYAIRSYYGEALKATLNGDPAKFEMEFMNLDGKPVPETAHLLHLADRTAVLLRMDRPILGQIPERNNFV